MENVHGSGHAPGDALSRRCVSSMGYDGTPIWLKADAPVRSRLRNIPALPLIPSAHPERHRHAVTERDIALKSSGEFMRYAGLVVGLIACAATPALAQTEPVAGVIPSTTSLAPSTSTLAPTAPAEFVVGPIEIIQDVNGTPVRVVANDYFQVVGKVDGLHLISRLELDLSDLQQKFPSIIGALPLPSDNCGSYKPDNLIVTLPTRELRAEGDHATMLIAGKVNVWSCFENPIPKITIRWKRRFGIPYPVVERAPGDPFKNKSASQPFEATLPIYFRKINDTSLGIVTGTPNVKLKGQYVFITNGILNLAKIDINEEARKALSKAIAPNDLIKSIPEEFLAMNPTIHDATFFAKDGLLSARVNASAIIPPAKITEWITLMMTRPTPTPASTPAP